MRRTVDSVTGRRRSAYAMQPGDKRLRGGSGLGDAVYVRPIAEHLAGRGCRVTVCTNYPDVFLGAPVDVDAFTRQRINVVAHYVCGKADTRTTQWEDVQRSAGVEGVDLRFAWNIQNAALISGVAERAAGRPVVLVVGGRRPMGRSDGFGMELLPDAAAFERLVAHLSGSCYLVGLGRDEPLYQLPVHEDLNGATSVTDLLDLFRSCSGVLAQCSFAVPMSEVFDRPLLAVWSSRGLRAREAFIRQVTPQKVLAKATSAAVLDDAAPEALERAGRELTLRMREGGGACAS